MKTKLTLFLLLLLTFPILGNAQKIEVAFLIKPYLQDAEPNSIKIMWETTTEDESIVEWGTSQKLGQKLRENHLMLIIRKVEYMKSN